MQVSIKIIIVEDHEGYRESLRESARCFNIETIAEAENGIQLFELLEIYTPDIILLDLRMPKMNGSNTLDILLEKYPNIKVIIISFYSEQLVIDDYAMRGVKGYMPKGTFDTQQLGNIIQRVYRGGKYFYKDNSTPHLKLSERQKDIVHLKANGISDKEAIGEQLGITGSGVGKQEKKIMEKMKVSNLSAFYEFIFEHGLKYLRKPKKK